MKSYKVRKDQEPNLECLVNMKEVRELLYYHTLKCLHHTGQEISTANQICEGNDSTGPVVQD
jgi:hypothetical protein